MTHAVTLGRLAANAAPPGHIVTPIIGLIIVGSLIAVVALMRAERFGVVELLACATLFFLLGGTPVGRTVYDFLSTVTGGG